jgi:hypothetical protein
MALRPEALNGHGSKTFEGDTNMRKAILAVTVIAVLQGFASDASASDPV